MVIEYNDSDKIDVFWIPAHNPDHEMENGFFRFISYVSPEGSTEAEGAFDGGEAYKVTHLKPLANIKDIIIHEEYLFAGEDYIYTWYNSQTKHRIVAALHG
jgi:hypothetical protein